MSIIREYDFSEDEIAVVMDERYPRWELWFIETQVRMKLDERNLVVNPVHWHLNSIRQNVNLKHYTVEMQYKVMLP